MAKDRIREHEQIQDQQQASNPPLGTVTFLFTDIEGSTKLVQELRDQYASILADQRAILRQAFARHDGHEIDTQGDAFFVAFARAVDAVNAAVEAQRALATHAWPAGISVRVRMGLHTGEPFYGPTGYVGIDVHRAARICSIGHGGQVLLSEPTRALIENELPDQVTLKDLGEHRLRDLLRPERLFEVDIDGLDSNFPELNSLDSVPNNLPVQLTSFIGRETEIKEVKQLLAGTRLLTLTGTGGTGKTRLSLQVAADMLDEFSDGVWLVELAKLSDPTLIPQTLAGIFGVREIPGRPPRIALVDYLRAKELLLILDNCEHVIEACAELADALLRACPRLKIFASSRESLGIAGETAYRVPSLSLPAFQSSPAELAQCEAARLFIDRATAIQPHFSVTPANSPAVAQICRRLDGIPLALELAAARTKVLTVEQIAARLDDRFRLLTGGSRTALPRQQTLRAAIDWSYDLLSDAERTLLRRLSVFVNGCTYDAAESVCDGEDQATLDLLTHLVDKSLVTMEEQDSSARYRLLKTVRQYARDKLLDSGEAAKIRDRHLDYFRQFAQEAEPYGSSEKILRWFNHLEVEHDNLRAALEWALESSPVQALELAISLSEFWARRGYSTEGGRWLDEALTRTLVSPPFTNLPESARTLTHAQALLRSARLALARGDYRYAHAKVEQGLDLARQTGSDELTGFALAVRGLVASVSGDFETSKAAVDESIPLLQERGPSSGLVMALATRAQILAHIERNYAAARAYLDKCIRLAQDAGMLWEVGVSMTNAGQVALLLENYDDARTHFRECIELFSQSGDRHFANVARSGLAETERAAGNWQGAVPLYGETIQTWRALGHRGGIARCIECVAFIASGNGEAKRAARLLGSAEALREISDSPMTAAERVECDREIEALRLRLAEGDLRAAWQEGRAMTMEQTIAYALEKQEIG